VFDDTLFRRWGRKVFGAFWTHDGLRAAAHGDCRQCDTYAVQPNMLLFTVSRDANLHGTECLGIGHHDERRPAFSHRHAADIAD
jgi:hypothetical protein